ncbi:hypothetical protein BJ684DRAFT_10145 [Piptocephalis cylindrospora]|uniref:S1 motif domain-containing protein n=1 Tax=Piptocephalis cylindrospora TaxID=1907219 RepID=A0A4P9Y3A8_9FUNG|nr:hypothetical protein BJ684DRAFT_10145 [Piptocephalis cylindrospora]|eukprot:RKP13386.1 hypothetical protein BJ684DRAFT_10145 [Piptocephalis cylindrospora]
MSELVVPGQRLGHTDQLVPGTGTFARGDLVYASVVGQVRRTDLPNGPEGKMQVTVHREKEASTVPEVDGIVVGTVLRVNPRAATLSIQVVGERTCTNEFNGVIRVEDIRATEKDKVKMTESFRPGDVVRAQVVSLGDARSYYLSTAKNILGVLHAKSLAGAPMYPVSWREMKCSQTGGIELRKCAKPF